MLNVNLFASFLSVLMTLFHFSNCTSSLRDSERRQQAVRKLDVLQSCRLNTQGRTVYIHFVKAQLLY